MEKIIKELEELITNNKINKSILAKRLEKCDIFYILTNSIIIKEYLKTYLKKQKYTESELILKYGEILGNALIVLASQIGKLEDEDYEYIETYSKKSSVDLFFDEVRSIPIMDKKKTIEYIELYQKYLKLYEKTKKEEYKKKYIEYQNIIVSGNIRLVMKNAHEINGRGIEEMELVDEGTIGMIRSLKTYDSSLGFSFSTYATWWIRQMMYRCIQDKSKNVRIPVYLQMKYHKYLEVKEKLANDLGHEPTINQIALFMDEDVKNIEFLINSFIEVESLDAPKGKDEDDDYNGYSFIKAHEFEQDFLNKDYAHSLLECLKEEEKEIIIMRFFENLTLEQIGKKKGLTRERIRQKENKILRKIKKLSGVKFISFYECLSFCDNILDYVDSLSEEEQIFLYKTFGKSLRLRVPEVNIDKNRLLEIIKKIKKIKEEKDEQKREKLKKFHFENKTLAEILIGKNNLSSTDLERVNYLWNKLKRGSKIYSVLHIAFGEYGVKKCDFSSLTKAEIEFTIDYLLHLQSSLKTLEVNNKYRKEKYEIYNNLTLSTIFNISKKELSEMFALIKSNSKFKKFIYKIFGDTYDLALNTRDLSIEELDYLFHNMTLLINAYRNTGKYHRKLLSDIIGFVVPLEVRNNYILIKAFGEDLSFFYLNNLTKKEEIFLDKIIDELKTYYKKETSILPLEYQKIVLLYLEKNYSSEDIASFLNMPLSSVNTLLKQGLEILNKEKQENGQVLERRSKNM